MYNFHLLNQGYKLGFEEPEDFRKGPDNSRLFKNCPYYKPYPKKGRENDNIFNQSDKKLIKKYKQEVDLINKITQWEHLKKFGEHSVFCSGQPCLGYGKNNEQTCEFCQQEFKKKQEKITERKLILQKQGQEMIKKLSKKCYNYNNR